MGDLHGGNRVYIVSDVEQGVIGCFSNRRLAQEVAEKYGDTYNSCLLESFEIDDKKIIDAELIKLFQCAIDCESGKIVDQFYIKHVKDTLDDFNPEKVCDGIFASGSSFKSEEEAVEMAMKAREDWLVNENNAKN